MKKKSKFIKYFKEYKWSNIIAMIKNSNKPPKICEDDFKDKLVVITGATSGIGYWTAKKYAQNGANLLLINRNIEKSEKLKKEIEDEFNIRCDYLIADLSRLVDTYEVAKKLLQMKESIDVLIHNAGVYLTKKQITEDGLEKVFVVNYLSTFIINYILMKRLKEENKARIIMVGSEGHRFAAWGLKLDDLFFEKQRYSGLKSYGYSKTAQLLSMIAFSKYFKDSKVTINTMHPGAVLTESGKDNGRLYQWYRKNILDKLLKSPKISAEALYYLGVSKEIEGISGKYFNLTTIEEPAPPALDKDVAYKLWEISIKLARLDQNI